VNILTFDVSQRVAAVFPFQSYTHRTDPVSHNVMSAHRVGVCSSICGWERNKKSRALNIVTDSAREASKRRFLTLLREISHVRHDATVT